MHKRIATALFLLSIVVMIAVVAADIQGKNGVALGKSGKELSNWTGAVLAFFLSFSSFWLLKYCKMGHTGP
jgi:hypothetical protein